MPDLEEVWVAFYRGGGGGGGVVRTYLLEPMKTLILIATVVLVIAGARAAVTVVYDAFHFIGMSIGYVVAGFPVGADSYHEGTGQMDKYVQAHPVPGAKKGKTSSWTLHP